MSVRLEDATPGGVTTSMIQEIIGPRIYQYDFYTASNNERKSHSSCGHTMLFQITDNFQSAGDSEKGLTNMFEEPR